MCTALREFAARYLKLHPHDQLNIHSFTCTNPLLNTKEFLVRAALLVYSAYRASNHQRHTATPLHGVELYNALCEWAVEGVKNHGTSSGILARTWRGLPEEPLPPIP